MGARAHLQKNKYSNAKLVRVMQIVVYPNARLEGRTDTMSMGVEE